MVQTVTVIKINNKISCYYFTILIPYSYHTHPCRSLSIFHMTQFLLNLKELDWDYKIKKS